MKSGLIKKLLTLGISAVAAAMIFEGGVSANGYTAAVVKSINHRGYNTVMPEDTLPAYMLSKAEGFDFVETDISFTKDNVPVLLHNPSINKMARNLDGSKIGSNTVYIKNITYEEALQYDFTGGKAAYKGTKITSLEEFLDYCTESGLHPYLELKDNGEYTREHIGMVMDMVRERGLERKVTWISFDHDYLQWVREKDPNARLGFLGKATDEETLMEVIDKAKALRSGTNYVFLGLASTYPSNTVEECKKENLPLEIWMKGAGSGASEDAEREVLENLDPYISGVTVNKYQYSRPDSVTLSKTSFVYDGEKKMPEVTATHNGVQLVDGVSCNVDYIGDCTQAGTYTVKVSLRDEKYAGAGTVSFEIKKADNPLAIRAKNAKLSYKKLKKKSRVLTKSKTVDFSNKGVGTVTYDLVSVNNVKYKKHFKIDSKTGALSIKKGLARGTYRVKIKVKAAGDKNYKASKYKTVTSRIVVR